MQPALFKVQDNSASHRLEIDLGEGVFAFASYRLQPGEIRFYHTEVPESHGGQGLGTLLVKAGIAMARERDLKLVPDCPFFRAYLKKNPDERDLVPSSHLYLLD